MRTRGAIWLCQCSLTQTFKGEKKKRFGIIVALATRDRAREAERDGQTDKQTLSDDRAHADVDADADANNGTLHQHEGKLSLEDHPNKYLPYFKINDADINANIKVRNLLTHS